LLFFQNVNRRQSLSSAVCFVFAGPFTVWGPSSHINSGKRSGHPHFAGADSPPHPYQRSWSARSAAVSALPCGTKIPFTRCQAFLGVSRFSESRSAVVRFSLLSIPAESNAIRLNIPPRMWYDRFNQPPEMNSVLYLLQPSSHICTGGRQNKNEVFLKCSFVI
jgi:hypothetical protein